MSTCNLGSHLHAFSRFHHHRLFTITKYFRLLEWQTGRLLTFFSYDFVENYFLTIIANGASLRLSLNDSKNKTSCTPTIIRSSSDLFLRSSLVLPTEGNDASISGGCH